MFKCRIKKLNKLADKLASKPIKSSLDMILAEEVSTGLRKYAEILSKFDGCGYVIDIAATKQEADALSMAVQNASVYVDVKFRNVGVIEIWNNLDELADAADSMIQNWSDWVA